MLCIYCTVYNIDNVDGISELNSSYITIYDNSTDYETDETNYNSNGLNTFRRCNDKKLSGGAIAAIFLSCVVVLSVIIGIIYWAKIQQL